VHDTEQIHKQMLSFYPIIGDVLYVKVSPESIVSIATCYRLDGPGIELRWG